MSINVWQSDKNFGGLSSKQKKMKQLFSSKINKRKGDGAQWAK
jgi:hypothetical protein